MRVVEIGQPGGPEVLQAAVRPRPVAGSGEVLIRVQAAGVNRPDVLQRKGAYAPPPGTTDIPGLEVAGTVEGGDLAGSGWSVGERVCALVAGGGYAEWLRGARRPVPADPRRPQLRRCGRAAGDLLHGLGGRLDAASAAVDFLVRLLEAQPDPGRMFLSSMTSSGELLRGDSGPRPGADRQVRFSGRFQIWWAISFPLAFLARYAEVSGEQRGLRAARDYLALLDRCRQAWDDISAGKAALGCAYLYRLTAEPGFRARAFKAVRAIVSRLAADGGVRSSPGGERGSVQLRTVFDYDANAEFALVMASES